MTKMTGGIQNSGNSEMEMTLYVQQGATLYVQQGATLYVQQGASSVDLMQSSNIPEIKSAIDQKIKKLKLELEDNEKLINQLEPSYLKRRWQKIKQVNGFDLNALKLKGKEIEKEIRQLRVLKLESEALQELQKSKKFKQEANELIQLQVNDLFRRVKAKETEAIPLDSANHHNKKLEQINHMSLIINNPEYEIAQASLSVEKLGIDLSNYEAPPPPKAWTKKLRSSLKIQKELISNLKEKVAKGHPPTLDQAKKLANAIITLEQLMIDFEQIKEKYDFLKKDLDLIPELLDPLEKIHNHQLGAENILLRQDQELQRTRCKNLGDRSQTFLKELDKAKTFEDIQKIERKITESNISIDIVKTVDDSNLLWNEILKVDEITNLKFNLEKGMRDNSLKIIQEQIKALKEENERLRRDKSEPLKQATNELLLHFLRKRELNLNKVVSITHQQSEVDRLMSHISSKFTQAVEGYFSQLQTVCEMSERGVKTQLDEIHARKKKLDQELYSMVDSPDAWKKYIQDIQKLTREIISIENAFKYILPQQQVGKG